MNESPRPSERNELVIELADQTRVAIDVRAKRPGPDMALVEGVFRLDLVGDVPGADRSRPTSA